jgi:hypothetical protein
MEAGSIEFLPKDFDAKSVANASIIGIMLTPYGATVYTQLW